MRQTPRLMTLAEVAEALQLHPEVVRRWLRQGKIPGCKVGRSWRVRELDLGPWLPSAEPTSLADSSTGAGTLSQTASPVDGPKMCFKFPKWLEFSGLPKHLNAGYGPEAWPVFKKIIELDFELGEPDDRTLDLHLAELEERVGYPVTTLDRILKCLEREGLIRVTKKAADHRKVRIITPLKTPKIILDIPFRSGGIKNAPDQALGNRCLRRYLEASEAG